MNQYFYFDAMDELGSEARALVEAGRAALRPTAADRARVLGALGPRVNVGGSGHGGPAPVAVKSGLGWQAISALAVGLVVAGGTVYLSVRGKPEPAPAVPQAHAGASILPPVVPVAPSVAAPSPAEAPAPTAALGTPAPLNDARPAVTRRSDRLAEEVAILSRAETELHAGHFASALKLLDEHAKTFPRGTLRQERIAARVQALCGLGRVDEAKVDLARIAKGSLQESGARDACSKH